MTGCMYSNGMRDLVIDKLDDQFGQYVIYLRCVCGHIRRCHPHTLAAFAGWDARLDDVVRRMRCSKCNQKKCTARAVAMAAPRGYKSH
jgi:hypothetical protein